MCEHADDPAACVATHRRDYQRQQYPHQRFQHDYCPHRCKNAIRMHVPEPDPAPRRNYPDGQYRQICHVCEEKTLAWGNKSGICRNCLTTIYGSASDAYRKKQHRIYLYNRGTKGCG